MRINFFRAIRHRNEEDYSPYIPRNFPRGTQTFSLGRPFLFRGIRPGRRVQLKPYGLIESTGQAEGGIDSDTDTASGVRGSGVGVARWMSSGRRRLMPGTRMTK